MRLLSLGIVMLVFVASGAKTKTAILPPEITAAKSICLVARLGPVGNGGYTPDLQRATSQVTEILEKWGRYSMVADPVKADLILVITEGHYGSVTVVNGYMNGNLAHGTAQDVAVLGDILQVYKGGSLPDDKVIPLWTGVETGGYSWPAKRAANKFKKGVQDAEKR